MFDLGRKDGRADGPAGWRTDCPSGWSEVAVGWGSLRNARTNSPYITSLGAVRPRTGGWTVEVPTEAMAVMHTTSTRDVRVAADND